MAPPSELLQNHRSGRSGMRTQHFAAKEDLMPENQPRNWWKSAVIYQVYPKSFADTTGSGQGDLQGIITHLDYLHDLGIDLIWLSPVYASPQKDNGYDVADFCSIDPRFGTLADFDALCAASAERGIGIIMDMILNHTSSEHPWFKDACSRPGSPWHDFYIWSDTDDGTLSVFGDPAWTYVPQTGQYYFSSFSPHQPDLDWRNPQVRRAIFDAMKFWIHRGVRGFRLDAVPYISKDLPHGRKCQGPELHGYLREMRHELGEDVLLCGEDTEADLPDALIYTNPSAGELNLIFEFGLEDYDRAGTDKWSPAPFDAAGFSRHYADWQLGLARRGRMALFLTNHDMPRAVSRWGDDGFWWRESATMLATAVYLLEGNVVIYQGEELGMTNLALPIGSYNDLETHNFYEARMAAGADEGQIMTAVWMRSRDNARTPMQWNDSPQAGFTAGTPWLPVNPNYARINADAEQHDPDSVWNYYRRLLRLRRDPVLQEGTFAPVIAGTSGTFAYTRTLGTQRIQVACNFTAGMQPDPFSGGELLLGNYPTSSIGPLRPYEARVTGA